jgi:hypothetical protein
MPIAYCILDIGCCCCCCYCELRETQTQAQGPGPRAQGVSCSLLTADRPPWWETGGLGQWSQKAGDGRLYLVRLFYKLYLFGYSARVHFRYKNGDCIESDYHAVSGPSGASDCRDSFVSRCRITPVPLGRSGSDRRAFYRVTGADLANLANLRLRAEAQCVFLGVATFATAVTNGVDPVPEG